MQLLPCPSCSRHILLTEDTCPFCSAAVSGLLAERAPPARSESGSRLSRAAMIALGALAVAPTACGGESESNGTGGAKATGGAPGAGGESSGTGGGSEESGGARGDGGASTGGSQIGPVYGAPATGGEPSNSGTGGDQNVPVYGAAPLGAQRLFGR